MRAGLPAVLLGFLVMGAGLAGCIQGAFFPAEIPRSAWAAGWSLDSGSSDGGEEGLEPIVKARWAVNAYRDTNVFIGMAFVVSVSSVPIFDVQGEIKKRIDEKLAENQITISNPRSGSGTIGGDATQFIIYDAEAPIPAGGTARGFAVDAPYTCKANGMNVRVFGFAATEVQGGILGTQRSSETWNELVGTNPDSAVGGMVAKTRCS